MVTISIPPQNAPATERRTHPRYACQAGVEIRAPEAAPLWGTATDLSRFGCYVEMPSPLAAGKDVSLTLTLFGSSFEANAEVVVSHPMFGMGLKFKFATPEAITVLEDFLRRLADEAAAPATKTSSTLPVYRPIPRLSGESALKILEQISRYLAEKKAITREDFEAILRAQTLHKTLPM